MPSAPSTRSSYGAAPADDEPGAPADGILRGLYLGAAGMMHVLRRLADAGLYSLTLDGPAIVEGLHEAALASPDEEGAGASLLVGSSGILLAAACLEGAAAFPVSGTCSPTAAFAIHRGGT
jgi:hypothetical protein